jgi:hypothetical protein
MQIAIKEMLEDSENERLYVETLSENEQRKYWVEKARKHYHRNDNREEHEE